MAFDVGRPLLEICELAKPMSIGMKQAETKSRGDPHLCPVIINGIAGLPKLLAIQFFELFRSIRVKWAVYVDW